MFYTSNYQEASSRPKLWNLCIHFWNQNKSKQLLHAHVLVVSFIHSYVNYFIHMCITSYWEAEREDARHTVFKGFSVFWKTLTVSGADISMVLADLRSVLRMWITQLAGLDCWWFDTILSLSSLPRQHCELRAAQELAYSVWRLDKACRCFFVFFINTEYNVHALVLHFLCN